ncbi:MAG: uroporphyrinogen-III C-methyltransferase [Chloroflexi bacterium]|nr:uroporphyrinogen-III C-methyltransferase [Chloroflexota bacterium]
MRPGLVSIVGAGPGDPDLITVGALRRLQAADVVLFDRLVDGRLLDQARPDAELLDVGKVPGKSGQKQTDINALLVDRARQGKSVVRLKGGDPFVFGRGGEEADALHAEGVPFEIVPGVTSAVAAPAYAGIPVTQRGFSSTLTIVTGNEAPGKPESEVDWKALAEQKGTLVVLMGWENLAGIVETLVTHGRPANTPVALVRWGTEPDQQTIVGTLADIVGRAENAGFGPPVVFVVGEVVTLRDRLGWFDTRSLFGKRVLVTRTRVQAGQLSSLLTGLGARPIELPTIEFRQLEDTAGLDAALESLDEYDWVVFASVNAVTAVFERLAILGRDTRAFGTAKVAAIGLATAKGLAEHGITADLVPSEYFTKGMVDGLEERGLDGARVLLPRADIAPDTLSSGLEKLGARVYRVVAYATATPDASRALVKKTLEEGVDVATFTSSSTVTNLVGLLDGNLAALAGVTIACIGPVTAETAGALGLEVDIVAKEHTVPGLVKALEEHFGSHE